jgi:hypothetical protein
VSLNPALPLLAALGAGGLAAAHAAGALFRRRPSRSRGEEIALVWGVLAFAATALLAPALALPGGIPSPAATLAATPPWLGTEPGTSAGNPVLRDVTFAIQPWQLFTRRELRAGRLPLWNPYQLSGTPFWSNGQSAPLFPLHLLFAALPLQLGFVLLPWLRAMTAGCGAWALARRLGLSRPGALLAALIFPLSGMLVSFLLFPMGNALVLVPWVLWAVERIAAGAPAGWAGLAVAGGLQLLAGHPETAAYTAFLSGIWLLVRGAARPLAAWLRFTAGWFAAAGLAAVQIVPLALMLPETSHWQSQAAAHTTNSEPPFLLLLEQPLRLVLPQMYGHPAEGTWWGPFNYSATAVYAGVLALPLAAAGLVRCRGDRRWRAVAVLLAFSFAAAYHWPGLREVLAALPVLGRAAPHRLIFGVELSLALLAGAGCDEWLAGRGRGLPVGAGLVAVMLAAAWGLFAGDWSRHGLTTGQLGWTAAALAAALLLSGSLLWSRERRWLVWPLVPALALCDLLAAHGGINRALPLERFYPETGAVRFLRGQEGRVAGLGEALRPNSAMVYGLFDPRGDDVKLERYEAVYRTFSPGDPVYYQPIDRWGAPWLDRLGVRWVVAHPGESPPDPRWRLAYGGAEGWVFDRPGALPLVRWSGAEGETPHVEERVPGRWEIAWRTAAPARLVVAETWDRGWTARDLAAGGREIPLVPADGALLGVDLGPGAGRVELRYRPPGLVAGAVLTGLTLLLLVGTAIAFSFGRWRPLPLGVGGGRHARGRVGEGAAGRTPPVPLSDPEPIHD